MTRLTLVSMLSIDIAVENGKTDNLLWIKVINDEVRSFIYVACSHPVADGGFKRTTYPVIQGEQITLTKLYGQFYSADATTKAESTRNTTIFGMSQPVLPHTKSRRMNYTFHSENPTGPRGLRVFIDFVDAVRLVLVPLAKTNHPCVNATG